MTVCNNQTELDNAILNGDTDISVESGKFTIYGRVTVQAYDQATVHASGQATVRASV